MKVKSMLGLVAALAASVASAATLKWQINADCAQGWTSAGLHRATQDENYSYHYAGQLQGLNPSVTEAIVDFSGSENHYFYMNIYKNDAVAANSIYEKKGQGYVTYDQIMKAIKSAGKYEFKDYSSGTVMGTLSLPEPTSGLLLLVGSAALALRRRRGAVLVG